MDRWFGCHFENERLTRRVRFCSVFTQKQSLCAERGHRYHCRCVFDFVVYVVHHHIIHISHCFVCIHCERWCCLVMLHPSASPPPKTESSTVDAVDAAMTAVAVPE